MRCLVVEAKSRWSATRGKEKCPIRAHVCDLRVVVVAVVVVVVVVVVSP